MQPGPRNPFLADSENPIAHGRCDQQDSTALTGPPSEVWDLVDTGKPVNISTPAIGVIFGEG